MPGFEQASDCADEKGKERAPRAFKVFKVFKRSVCCCPYIFSQALSPNTRVLVVGDVLQSIYKFLGSCNGVEILKQLLKPELRLRICDSNV